jgi:hypothetical protein
MGAAGAIDSGPGQVFRQTEPVRASDILSIRWSRENHFIDVVYADQAPDTLMGTKEMAEESGLVVAAVT